MNLNFPHSPESHQRSVAARWQPEEHRRLPFMEHCDFNKFLALLVEKHGEGYLKRPDGDNLAYRRPDGYVAGVVDIPQPAAVTPTRLCFSPHNRQRPDDARGLIAQALADGPKSIDEIVDGTGLKPATVANIFSIDRGKTYRNVDAGWWRLAEGDEIGHEVINQTRAPVPEAPPDTRHLLPTARIEAVLSTEPMTAAEIAKATGMNAVQVAAALNRSKRHKFRRLNIRPKNDYWRLATETDGEDRGRAPLLIEQMVAFLKANGPSTTHEMAIALERKRNAISATCYKFDVFVQAGKRGGRRLWAAK